MISFAVRLRGFGPLGLLAILVVLLADVVVKPLSAVLVLVWTWRSHTPWREIGYVRPRTWIGSLAIGVLFGVVFQTAREGGRDAVARRVAQRLLFIGTP